MISCFLHICRIFLCCEDEENQKERHEFERRSCYGSYQSPPQQRENLLVPSWKASSPHSSPSAASSPSYLSSSLAASLSKPSSPSLAKTSSAVSSSFAPPSPAKAQPNHAASAGAKASQLSEPSSKASSAAFSPSYLSSSLAASLLKPSSHSLTKTSSAVSSFTSPSPAKAQSNHAASAGVKSSQLSEPSSKASSAASSPSYFSSSLAASLSKSSSPSLAKTSSAVSSFAPPSPAKAQPNHVASAGAKASQLSEPSSSSLVSSKASSSSSSSLTPSVKAQSPHAASTSPKDSLQWKPVSSNASSASCSFLTPSTASSASPSAAKARPTHALSASESPAKACPLSEPSSPCSVLLKASSLSSSSLAPCLTAPFASPQFDQRNKMGQLPRYEIPKLLQEQIRNDVVPKVLRRPLSPSTYADYFAALLYAEDYYCEKWSDFLLRDVTLELRKKDSFKIQNSVGAKKSNNSTAHMDKPFVAFEIDSVPDKRPYLLSRDHVLVRPVGKQIEPFRGIFFRVEKSKWVLAEFSDDFHKQHSPLKKYDVSFSFNRVCLKRSHHAVSAAMDPFLCSILFPDPPHKAFLGPICDSDFTQNDRKSDVLMIIRQILRLKSPQPYLLEGPLSQVPGGDLSDMGKLIQIAIFVLYETCSSNRILVCAPRNLTLDKLTKGLLTKGIPESRIFRANAAFRDFDHVPDDIMPTCLFEGECFTCPPLAELKSFRVVTSTFISSYRLYAAGIGADHFTHIFLVDASSSTEPETIVAFANLVGKTTVIVVTGSARDSPAWVRSDIARKNGLKRSLFQRLLEMEPYSLHDPM